MYVMPGSCRHTQCFLRINGHYSWLFIMTMSKWLIPLDPDEENTNLVNSCIENIRVFSLMHALFPYPGMFYWTLLNVHPHTDHILRFIQLLAVAKSKAVKEYGIDAILEPAVKDLQVLARVSVAMHDDDTCSIVLL